MVYRHAGDFLDGTTRERSAISSPDLAAFQRGIAIELGARTLLDIDAAELGTGLPESLTPEKARELATKAWDERNEP